MDNILHKLPFIRVFVPFVLGIVLSILFDLNEDAHVYLLLFYAVLVTIYFILKYSKAAFYQLLFASTFNFLLFTVGIESCYLRNALNHIEHYSNKNLSQETLIRGYISGVPQLKERTIKTNITITHFVENEVWRQCEGEIIAYFPKDCKKLRVGKDVVFKNKLVTFSEPKNPYDFNYKKYLYYKNIYHQIYLKKKDFVLFGSPNSIAFADYPLTLKEKLLTILRENNFSADEYAITAALLLGYDDEISNELLGAYSRTGTLHVLSVSGLHVGVIFMILNFIIRLPNKRFFVVLKTGIIFCCVWFYALLTGFSPSVVRSATMFSFILIGTAINKKGNIYNTLLASAFIILLFDPFLIIDVGFQLSYLAVGGIVFFYPYVSNWFVSENKVLNLVWKTTAVSISAQIITLPLTLYYFGQFPSLFFIANLIVIPLSYGVMFGSMILVCVFKVKFLSVIFSSIVNWSVIAMNESTRFLDQFKFINISDVNTSFFEMILYFALIFFVTDVFVRKRYLSIISCALLICFLLVTSVFFVISDDKKQLIVFHVKDLSCIDYYANKHCNTFISSNFSDFNQTIVSVKQNRIKREIRDVDTTRMAKGFYVFSVGTKKIGILSRDTLTNYAMDDLALDYLVLSGNPYISGIDKVKLKAIIVDGSNNFKTIKYLQKKHLTNLWVTKEQGAFIF